MLSGLARPGADSRAGQCHAARVHRASRPPGRRARLLSRLCVVGVVLALTLTADVVERWPWQSVDPGGLRSEPGVFRAP